MKTCATCEYFRYTNEKLENKVCDDVGICKHPINPITYYINGTQQYLNHIMGCNQHKQTTKPLFHYKDDWCGEFDSTNPLYKEKFFRNILNLK